MRFLPGQRWISDTEPELGLGTVLGVDPGRVLVRYAATGEQRQYAIDQAPLRRVAFRPGESLTTRDGRSHEVARVETTGELLTYHTADGRIIPESDLSDALSFGSPEQRFLAGGVDSVRAYELRRASLDHRHRRRRSPVRGFVGGRMDLIPHQLHIAREVAGRHAPRVLLADEVGLGKTVEACLILHRLLAIGRAARVLIVVPESLVHQWFLELLRRFNLWFHIFDRERVEAVRTADPRANPFLEDQLVLCALPLLLESRCAQEAAEAGWDLLVVDEAHHLEWKPGDPSPEYVVIERLSRSAEGLLLLTATPEQLGLAGHFARLRLLDPDRYPDFQRFQEESCDYGSIAAVAGKLVAGAPLGAEDLTSLRRILAGEDSETCRRLEAAALGESAAREALVSDLLDRHGTGRVMFRNTRAAIHGFPRRRPHPVPLKAPADPERLLEALAAEFEEDVGRSSQVSGPGCRQGDGRFAADPRLDWLASLLRRRAEEKVLLITRSKAKVMAIDAALRTRLAVETALFHEDLELVQRDRNAAWFSEPRGARILLASEIGSEGRNFQFAHHLVLFDLPMDPELVEQRIGRLDRIGQTSDIQIHVPYVVNSPQEVLFRWYHEGLDAFGHNLVGGREMLEQFGAAVRDLAQDFHETHDTRRPELERLVNETRRAREELEHRLEQGRDRLLELNSHQPKSAQEIVDAIAALDADRALDEFLLEVWDHFGVPVEELGPRMFRIGADGVFAGAFPGLPAQGVVATLDRKTALSREDLTFLTWDHPMVTGALDLLLGRPDGSTSAVIWTHAPRQGFCLETLHVLECVAPSNLHADRFLPATPIRVFLSSEGEDITSAMVTALAKARLVEGRIHEGLDSPDLRQHLQHLTDASRVLAMERAEPVIHDALTELDARLGHELERLRSLARVNPAVRPEEVALLEAQRDDLRRHITAARLRLDSMRLLILAGR